MALEPALRTVTIHKAFAVYKDYDGNCPDGPVIVVCADKQLAKDVAAVLGKADGEEEGEWAGFSWPHSDGHEWSARWTFVQVEEESGEIATTLEDALKRARQFCG